MRRRRIREALVFDGNFGAAGFVELRPGSPDGDDELGDVLARFSGR